MWRSPRLLSFYFLLIQLALFRLGMETDFAPGLISIFVRTKFERVVGDGVFVVNQRIFASVVGIKHVRANTYVLAL